MGPARREPASPALRISLEQLDPRCVAVFIVCPSRVDEPQIRRTSVVEEDAAFDWYAFLNTTYTDTSDPVGNALTTGNNDNRFKDRVWSADGGVRRDNRLGGNVEFFQRLGTQENNSDFLVPNPQATSQLELRYTQPLLNGAGYGYNESRIVLAQIHADISSDDVIDKLQEHLYDVSEAYSECAVPGQVLPIAKIGELSRRDARRSSRVERGWTRCNDRFCGPEATVATRQSEIARAHTSIRNAESRLRLLVNDPVLVHAGGRAFAPEDTPLIDQLPLALDQSLYTALQHRPDISQAIRSIRASSVRLGVAQHEVLPKLDLVATAYVAGLAGQAGARRLAVSSMRGDRPIPLVSSLRFPLAAEPRWPKKIAVNGKCNGR